MEFTIHAFAYLSAPATAADLPAIRQAGEVTLADAVDRIRAHVKPVGTVQPGQVHADSALSKTANVDISITVRIHLWGDISNPLAPRLFNLRRLIAEAICEAGEAAAPLTLGEPATIEICAPEGFGGDAIANLSDADLMMLAAARAAADIHNSGYGDSFQGECLLPVYALARRRGDAELARMLATVLDHESADPVADADARINPTLDAA